MFTFESHGSFSIKFEGDVIKTYVSESFNKEGVQKYQQEIMAISASLDSWILVENVSSSAALTPEALEMLTDSYSRFEKSGCRGIVMHIQNTFKHIIKSTPFTGVSIPIKVVESESEISNMIQELTSS